MSATEWNKEENPKGWWMSEKYDGIRILWDGSQFLSRQGNKINICRVYCLKALRLMENCGNKVCEGHCKR